MAAQELAHLVVVVVVRARLALTALLTPVALVVPVLLTQ
jgi:hypothetical protein